MNMPAPGAGQPDNLAAGEVEPRDLTTEAGQIAAPLTTPSEILGPPTKPTFTDWARISLAGVLLGVLAVLTLGSGWFVAVYPQKEAAIVNFLKLVFTPIVGLVGSVVGFYFGSHAVGGSGRRNGG